MKIICDWENCNETGVYKAPVEKDNSKKYRLLCLNHIKIFNKNWNYFENMSDQEIEFFIKSDLTWHKSTKTFGSSDNFFNILWNNALDDRFFLFGGGVVHADIEHETVQLCFGQRIGALLLDRVLCGQNKEGLR